MNFLKAPRQYIRYRSRSPSPVPRLGGFEYREDRDRVSNLGPESEPGLKPEPKRDPQALAIDQYDLPPPAYAEKETIQERKDQARSDCNDEINQLWQLKQFDTIFILDDSGSMAKPLRGKTGPSRWNEAKRILKRAAQEAKKYDQDGIDILCVNQVTPSSEDNNGHYETEEEIDKFFNEVSAPLGKTPLHRPLERILSEYMLRLKTQIEKKKRGGFTRPINPINVVVITDGKPDDKIKVESIILKYAAELENLNRTFSVGIQFVQVGFSRKATNYLQSLDTLATEHQGIADIVDTVPADLATDGTIPDALLIKILLGGVNRAVDAQNELVKDDTSDEE
ncbi:hypothetical protein QCA50_000912 [Cerrena zonata]|uniref:VWFA domain-containing protein n=1 Tax=Cerrena zonata TaxID=2478898 RepID=A0AAW0GXK7_9APHY